MKVATYILLIGIVGIASGFPIQDDAPQMQSSPGKDEVSYMMHTMLSHIAGILRFMESTRWMTHNHQQAPSLKLSNSKYAVAGEIPPLTGDAMGFILATFKAVFKTSGTYNQEFGYFIDSLRDNNLLTYLRDMAMGYSVNDMINLAMSDPQLQGIYQTAVKAMPAFRELMDHVHNASLQDRALIDVLMGNMPSVPDYNAISSKHTVYSLNVLTDAMKDDQHFQDFLADVEAGGQMDLHDVLKLITGQDLQLLSDIGTNGPTKNSSVKIDENNFLVQYGEIFDFLLLNFAKIIQLVEAYDKSSPNLSDIMKIIMTFDTSMLQPSPGKVARPKPTMKMVYHGALLGPVSYVHHGVQGVNTVTPHVATFPMKGRRGQKKLADETGINDERINQAVVRDESEKGI